MITDTLIKHEGLRLLVYDDATGKPIKKGDTLQGNPTIGIGRELSKTGITDSEARYLLNNDIKRFSDELDKRLSWWREMSQARQDVILSMAFNMGVDGLLGFKNMLTSCKIQDWKTASHEMLTSKWASQVGKRATELAHQLTVG